MYESYGFHSAGVRRRYYHDNNEDALIMWRTDGRGHGVTFAPADGPPVGRHLRGAGADRRLRRRRRRPVAAAGARDHRRHRRSPSGAGTRLSGPIFAIETSCDDTCAAVVTREGEILSNVISSQSELHARYGGVVPEVASRHHLELVNVVVEEALAQAGTELAEVDAVAATSRPGLIGALLVGLSTAKALAAAAERPFIAVDHLHGHVCANFLEPDPLDPPFLCLIASGGHTLLAWVEDHRGYTELGSTRDDAAGEALDKAARLMGLGFPGGAVIDRLAREGDPQAFALPGRHAALRLARVLVQRPQDGARLRGARPRPRAGRATPGRPRGLVPAGGRRPADGQARAGARPDRRRRGSRWEAAWRPTPSCARAWRRSAATRAWR